MFYIIRSDFYCFLQYLDCPDCQDLGEQKEKE